MATSHYYFPEEILFIILSWLPVKSLGRFASVCKLWLSIITHPEFIQTHLTNSQKKPTLLIQGTIYNRKIRSWQPRACIGYPNYCEVPVFSYLHFPSPLADLNLSLSCNGLLCLNDLARDRIYLCNPSTMQFKLLPSPDVQSDRWPPVYTGFYFDSFSNDYKILWIAYQDNNRVRAQLYSVESNLWREIQVNRCVTKFIRDYHNPSLPCCLIKGVLYMSGSDSPISFQLHNEVFKPVSLPRIKNYLGSLPSMFDFRGSVAIILHCCDDDGLLSLWTLDDNAGDVKWTKNFNFEAGIYKMDQTFYLGDGQFVSSDWRSETIILYDYKKKDLKKLDYPITIESFYKHTESLVSIPGFIKF